MDHCERERVGYCTAGCDGACQGDAGGGQGRTPGTVAAPPGPRLPRAALLLWAYEGIDLVGALLTVPGLPLRLERDAVSLRYELSNIVDVLGKSDRFAEPVTVSYV